MPRPERPIDPSEGPLQQFAAALRKLRIEAGSPPYRTMAAEAHASKASLSAAAAGHRLPTWEITRAYVTVCGGDVEEWRRRWVAVRAEIGYPPAEPQQPEAPPTATATRNGRRERYVFSGPVLLAGAVCAALVVAVLVAWAVWTGDDPVAPSAVSSPAARSADGVPSGPPSGSPARFVGGTEPLADNADPKKSGCGADPAKVTTLDSVEVNTINENLLGIAQLRHASDCHASWGRFEPSDRLTYLPGPFTVTITAHRPATGTVGTPFSVAFDGQPVFGNILLVTSGCVEITVEVRSPHGDGSATTACLR